MICRLRGAVVECAGGELILDVGGVGYQVFIAETALESLPAKGETATLFISTHVREDAIQLYGFPRSRKSCACLKPCWVSGESGRGWL